MRNADRNQDNDQDQCVPVHLPAPFGCFKGRGAFFPVIYMKNIFFADLQGVMGSGRSFHPLSEQILFF
jgi:hypothetical protein